jgi:glycosyltransferase involved in cell wall biosynthesis
MKILFSTENFYPPRGGGALSILTLLEELAKKFEVEAFYLGKETKVDEHKKIVLTTIKSGLESNKNLGLYRMFLINKKWRLFKNYVKEKKPDLILTQGNLIPASIETALKYNIKSAAFVRNYSFMCITAFMGVENAKLHSCVTHANLRKIVQYPAFKKFFNLHMKFLKKTFVISNSEFTRKMVKSFCGEDSPVVYPAVNYENYKVKRKNPKYITIVNPRIHKGVDIFMKIADAMPEKEFLAVGGTSKLEGLKKKSNIKYIPWTVDMKRIYDQTRTLL